jgi:hypothetical protein
MLTELASLGSSPESVYTVSSEDPAGQSSVL